MKHLSSAVMKGLVATGVLSMIIAIALPSGATAQTVCVAGTTLCHGQCTTLGADYFNCGACGRICGPGDICSVGNCVSAQTRCPTGTRLCRDQTGHGGCANVETNPRNCGACGMTCQQGHQCVNAQCK
jgi:hypothetical protein